MPYFDKQSIFGLWISKNFLAFCEIGSISCDGAQNKTLQAQKIKRYNLILI